MRKNTFLAALAIAAAMCSCTKKELPTDKENLPEDEMQTIYARVNIATKVAYSEVNEGGGAGLTSVWSEGDHFYAIQDGSTVVQFTLSSGAGKTNAIFKARAAGVTDATTWTGVLGSAAKASGSEILCDYNGQGGTLASLSAYNYVKADAEGSEPTFDFENGEKLSYILRIKLPAGIKEIEYTPSAWHNVTSSAISENLYNANEKNDYTATNCSTITLPAASTAGQFAYIALPASDFSPTRYTYNSNKQNGNYRCGVIITILNDVSNNATASNGDVIRWNLSEKGGQVRTFDMSNMTLMARPKPSDAIKLTTSNVSAKIHSSALTEYATKTTTYWAPFNVGASNPQEVGNYYAFGEWETRSDFTFVNYTLRHKPGSSNYEDYTCGVVGKLTSSGSNVGNVRSIAGSLHDVARVKWGKDWRMPYAVELWALMINNTSKSWNSSSGSTFGADNGASIFVPNSTYMNGTTRGDSKFGRNVPMLLSSEKLNENQGGAGWNECFSFTYPCSTDVGDWWRDKMSDYFGYTVRAVCVAANAASTIE